MERETGIEPATNSLEGCDSTTELLPPFDSPRTPIALRKARSRQSRRVGTPASTILRLRFSWPSLTDAFDWPRFADVVRLRAAARGATTSVWLACQPKLARRQRAEVGGEGRIRTSEAARATDLQSAAFDRSATSPSSS
jgi:hypothetical protein